MPLVKGPDIVSYHGDLPEVIRQFVDADYVLVAGHCAYVYHYWTTISEEVAHIWSQKWGTGKILFMITRYLPMLRIATSILLEIQIRTTLPPSTCRGLAFAFMLSHFFATLTADGAFILCIYALLGARKRWMLLLSMLYVGVSIPLLGLTVIYLLGRDPKPNSGIETELGYACAFYPGRKDIYGSIMNYLTMGATIVTAAIGVGVVVMRYRDHRSRLMGVLRKDGAIFYVFALSLRFTAALQNTPDIQNFDRYNISWNLHALLIPVFATQLMIHMRKVNNNLPSSTVISSLVFEQPDEDRLPAPRTRFRTKY